MKEKDFIVHYSGIKVAKDGEIFVPESTTRPQHLTYGSKSGNGYKMVGYKRKRYYVHILVAEVFLNNNKPIEKDYDVHHLNEDKTDNRVDNLRIITREEHGRLHMKDKKGENHPMYGKHPSEETRKKLSNSHKGHIVSIETRIKLSEANSGENNPHYGKHLSKEHREKISEANKGKHSGENHPMYGKLGAENPTSKPIIGTNKTTGEIIEFAGVHEAARALGISATHISACCKRKRKSAGGFIWQYA
jgi:group I intron endonuclease